MWPGTVNYVNSSGSLHSINAADSVSCPYRWMICNIEAEPSGDKILRLDDALSRQHLARLLDDARSGIMDACARTGDASLPLQPTDFIHPRKDLIGRHEVGVFAFSGRSRKQHRFHFVHDVGWHEHRTNANTPEIRSQAVFSCSRRVMSECILSVGPTTVVQTDQSNPGLDSSPTRCGFCSLDERQEWVVCLDGYDL